MHFLNIFNLSLWRDGRGAGAFPFVMWDMSEAETSGGNIASVRSAGSGPTASALNGSTPLTSGAAVFNGSAGSRVLGYDYDVTPTFDAITQLPDASSPGAEGVAGFTVVGASRFADGTLCCGNLGQNRDDTNTATYPREPGWVEIDPDDLGTAITEVTPSELQAPTGSAAGGQVQGFAVDGDDNVWVMVKNADALMQFTRAGVHLQTVDISGQVTTLKGNGAVYLAGTNEVAVNDESGHSWFCYSAEDGSYNGSFTTHSMGSGTVDQGFMIGGNILCWTKGSNGTAGGGGRVYYQELDFSGASAAVKANGARGQWGGSITRSEAPEGGQYIPATGKLLLFNDPGFHAADGPYTDAFNNVVELDALPPLPAYGASVTFGFVTDLDSNGTGGAVTVLASPGSASNTNFAIYQSSSNGIQVFLRDFATGDLLGLTWAVDITGPHFWTLTIDLEGNSATLTIDGEDQGAPTASTGGSYVTIAAYAGGIQRGPVLLGGADEGSYARFLSGSVYRVAVDADADLVAAALLKTVADVTMTATADAEASTADEAIPANLLTGLGGDRIVSAAGTFISAGGSETVSGTPAGSFAINSDGTGSQVLGATWQYQISGTTATSSVPLLTNLGERFNLISTVTGSYVASLTMLPEDGGLFTDLDSLPSGWSKTGSPTRTGGAAGTANIAFNGGSLDYTPSGASTLGLFSAQGVRAAGTDGTLVSATTASGGLTLVLSGTTLTASLTEGGTTVTATRTITEENGLFAYAIRCDGTALGLMVNGDTAAEEDTGDVSGLALTDPYTGLSLSGPDSYGSYLRVGAITAADAGSYLAAVMAERLPTGSIWVKSLVLDIADNHGDPTYLALRAVDLYREGVQVDLLGIGYAAYATSSAGGLFAAELAFDPSRSKTGHWSSNSWVTPSTQVTDQRLILVLNTPQQVDEVRVHPGHSSGASTNTGANNVVVYATEATITDTTYGAAVSGGEVLFDGAIAQHSGVDVVQDEVIYP